MTQDFAKTRPEPVLDKKQVTPPSSWSLLITGMVAGIAIGVFACALLYVSGRIPPLEAPVVAGNNLDTRASGNVPDASAASNESDTTHPDSSELKLEFYDELPTYEVRVDATPVDLSSQDPDRELESPIMLQAGAYQRQDLAEAEMRRQQVLGLPARVKNRNSQGRTLFLVQSGPYTTVGQLENAKQVLRRNQIQFIPSVTR